MGNLEYLMPIILEVVHWAKDKAGPSKKDLQLQMLDLREEVRALLATRGEDLAYQDFVIQEVLRRTQIPGNIEIHANTVNIYYGNPGAAYTASSHLFDGQSSRVEPFEEKQKAYLTGDLACFKPRIDIIRQLLEELLGFSKISNDDFRILLGAIEREELQAVGVYLEDHDHRIAEIKIAIDWDEYHQALATQGPYLCANKPDWERGLPSEICTLKKRFLDIAVNTGKPIYAWFSSLKQQSGGRNMREKIVYYFDKKVPTWAVALNERQVAISELKEITVTMRSF